jgi:hypothetical protein
MSLDAAVQAAKAAMSRENIQPPYMARIAFYTDPDGVVDREALRAADEQSERDNDAAVRRVVEAALSASDVVPVAAPEQVEPTLAAMRAAAEHARAANHAAYDAPGDPAALYSRVGALHDLLAKTKQLTEVLAEETTKLAAAPPSGLYSDDVAPPGGRALLAAELLSHAAESIAAANRAVNGAWSSLSHLGVSE